MGENKIKIINSSLFFLAIFAGVFFATGFFLVYKSANVLAATNNCICSSGSNIPFKYNKDAEYTTKDDESCRTACMGVNNAKYFSYSNAANIGYRRIFNCLCANGSLIPFNYPLKSKFNVDSDDACNQQCANKGTEYYSYSNLANLGAKEVTKSPNNDASEDATPESPESENQQADNKVPGTTESGGIIKCGRGGQNMCTLCDLIKGFNDVIHYIMKIAIGFALLAIAIGGVMYVVSAGDSGAAETAKNTIKNALIGFIIIFAAWLIVNTTMQYIGTVKNAQGEPTLGITITKWGQFDCTAASR